MTPAIAFGLDFNYNVIEEFTPLPARQASRRIFRTTGVHLAFCGQAEFSSLNQISLNSVTKKNLNGETKYRQAAPREHPRTDGIIRANLSAYAYSSETAPVALLFGTALCHQVHQSQYTTCSCPILYGWRGRLHYREKTGVQQLPLISPRARLPVRRSCRSRNIP